MDNLINPKAFFIKERHNETELNHLISCVDNLGLAQLKDTISSITGRDMPIEKITIIRAPSYTEPQPIHPIIRDAYSVYRLNTLLYAVNTFMDVYNDPDIQP
jgi:hypothetical protein